MTVQVRHGPRFSHAGEDGRQELLDDEPPLVVVKPIEQSREFVRLDRRESERGRDRSRHEKGPPFQQAIISGSP
jgi:hypothetical protein